VSCKLQQALERLYGQERRRDKLGLKGTRALLSALGNPELCFRSVHVAGTNGKGSVCAMVERVLRQSGLRTGLFTSPHLVDFRERIRVDGRWVDEDWLMERLEYIQSLPVGKDRTFFEVTTALAFDWFAHVGVEWAIVEVGLGGRLDTTNVLTPAVSVITSIEMDHGEVLGSTLDKIAAEKAGIAKPNVPLVVGHVGGVHAPGPLDIIRTRAKEVGAPIVHGRPPVHLVESDGEDLRETHFFTDSDVQVDLDVVSDGPGDIEIAGAWGTMSTPSPLAGPHQRRNVATALYTLATLAGAGVVVSARDVIEGLRKVRWPGRFEQCPTMPRLFWDGGHNPTAIREVCTYWSRTDERASAIVLALSRGKDAPEILWNMRYLARPLPLIVTQTRNHRAMPLDQLVACAARAEIDAVAERDVKSAVARALHEHPQGHVLLLGSLFAVGEAMELYGGAPGELM
jgi:dihydrofolate synthase/folylpolyglutamate synthase